MVNRQAAKMALEIARPSASLPLDMAVKSFHPYEHIIYAYAFRDMRKLKSKLFKDGKGLQDPPSQPDVGSPGPPFSSRRQALGRLL
jgi:hypothetical protein